jgi:hypothetical protein
MKHALSSPEPYPICDRGERSGEARPSFGKKNANMIAKRVFSETSKYDDQGHIFRMAVKVAVEELSGKKSAGSFTEDLRYFSHGWSVNLGQLGAVTFVVMALHADLKAEIISDKGDVRVGRKVHEVKTSLRFRFANDFNDGSRQLHQFTFDKSQVEPGKADSLVCLAFEVDGTPAAPEYTNLAFALPREVVREARDRAGLSNRGKFNLGFGLTPDKRIRCRKEGRQELFERSRCDHTDLARKAQRNA